MTTLARWFLGGEAAGFAAAALMHSGVLGRGHEHWKAGTAESVIAMVLLAGLAITYAAPAWSRAAAVTALAFALLGTGVGVIMIAIGVGPRTVLDVLIHAVFVVTLVAGLFLVARERLAGI